MHLSKYCFAVSFKKCATKIVIFSLVYHMMETGWVKVSSTDVKDLHYQYQQEKPENLVYQYQKEEEEEKPEPGIIIDANSFHILSQ